MTPKDCEHIAHLLFLAYTGEASPDQQEELSRWLKEDKHHDDLYRTIMDHERIRSEQEVFLLFNQQRAWTKISQKTYRKSKMLYTIFYGMQPYSFALSVSACISYTPISRKKRSKLSSYS